MELGLRQHVAIITGGASGIGYATARRFAEEGASVALWDRDESVQHRAQELETEFGVRIAGFVVDIANEQDVAIATSETRSMFGRLDHLVHAAAIGSGKFGFPFTRLTPGDWTRVLQVNVIGMANVAHAIAPQLIDQAAGTLLFVASVAGQIGSQTDPPYSASKAANINFAQCLAKDLAPHGVRVNSVCPGMVKTPLNESVWKAWLDQTPLCDQLSYDEWAEKKIKTLVPLGTWQTCDAVADMIVFLSSARAAHVTGQTINVDGGMVMHS